MRSAAPGRSHWRVMFWKPPKPTLPSPPRTGFGCEHARTGSSANSIAFIFSRLERHGQASRDPPQCQRRRYAESSWNEEFSGCVGRLSCRGLLRFFSQSPACLPGKKINACSIRRPKLPVPLPARDGHEPRAEAREHVRAANLTSPSRLQVGSAAARAAAQAQQGKGLPRATASPATS
jgi:hypothetical protein